MNTSAPANPFDLRQMLPHAVFLAPDMIEAVSTVFNANEYDPSLDQGIRACADRYRAVLVYAETTVASIHSCRQAHFTTDLNFINEELPLPEDVFCELNCPAVSANFDALLFAAKSLLDVVCKYLLRRRTGQSIGGFNKRGKIVGGRVLNVLKCNVSLAQLPSRDCLVDLIEQHKIDWIDDLVAMRDKITHTGQLENLIGFWLKIEGGRELRYTPVDVHDPVVAVGGGIQMVEEYCELLKDKVRQFSIGFRDALFPAEARQAALSRLTTTRTA